MSDLNERAARAMGIDLSRWNDWELMDDANRFLKMLEFAAGKNLYPLVRYSDSQTKWVGSLEVGGRCFDATAPTPGAALASALCAWSEARKESK